MINIKQTNALTILSALTLLSQTAEVTMAICQDEQAAVEKKMVSLGSKFLKTRNLALNDLLL